MSDDKSSLASRCPQCGYSLDGLAETICPECGFETDSGKNIAFRDHVDSIVNASFCYAIAGGNWLVINFVSGISINPDIPVGAGLLIAISHFVVSVLLYFRRFHLQAGMKYVTHTSHLSRLCLVFSIVMLMVALVITMS